RVFFLKITIKYYYLKIILFSMGFYLQKATKATKRTLHHKNPKNIKKKYHKNLEKKLARVCGV
ncbi:MAG: hypothetical protein LBE20_06710, partial [Deltaproteobacteria bacterium]|nr:hypothetical protein [Deltaproteobacteria bacterium]